jgi:hypothetical protein
LFSGDAKRKPVIRPLGGKSYSEAEIASTSSNASNVGSYGLGVNNTNTVSVGTVSLVPFTGSLINISSLSVNPINPSNLISTSNTLTRSGKLWHGSLHAKYITISDAEVRTIMEKTRASGSVSTSQMLNSQIVPKDKLKELDKYIAQTGLDAYIVGKSRVARVLGTNKAIMQTFGFIDVSKVPEDEVANDAQRAAFAKKYIKSYTLPYSIRVTLNNGGLSTERKSLQLHTLVGDSLMYALQEVLDFYGIDMIKKLGLNICEGTFVFRRQRNSLSVSTHAFGIGIDFLGASNAFAWYKNNALLGEGPYTAFIDIMEKWGWYNNGRWYKQDWMHFQAVQYYANQNNYIA